MAGVEWCMVIWRMRAKRMRMSMELEWTHGIIDFFCDLLSCWLAFIAMAACCWSAGGNLVIAVI